MTDLVKYTVRYSVIRETSIKFNPDFYTEEQISRRLESEARFPRSPGWLHPKIDRIIEIVREDGTVVPKEGI